MKLGTLLAHKRLSVTGIIAVVALLGFVGYRYTRGDSIAERYRQQAVGRGEVTQIVSANGTVNPVSLINVGTQISGIVKRLYVDFNARVTKGQVLAELDQSLLRAQESQSQANVLNAHAALELARANEARLRPLLDKEYVSRQEVDQAIQARKAAEAQVALAEAQLARDRINIGYTLIRSPVAGVVVDRSVDLGQTVAASFQTPVLFKIAQDLKRMQIDSNFAEADIGHIQVGLPARFTVDAFPDRVFVGKVRQVRLNPTTQQNVVTYDVVIDVDNPEEILRPGMTAYVNIPVAERKDVLLVPNAALRFKPADSAPAATRAGSPKKRAAASGVVYVIAEGKLTPIAVGLGITDNRNTEIVSGDLKAGDSVVVGENLPGADGRGSSPVRIRMF
jgi:HlyD family secretion protein